MMKSTTGAPGCGGIAVSSSKKDDAHKRTRRGHKGVLQLHHLPPDTLSDIMSLLSFKEAARMSLLSSQWRHLWRSCIRDLVFTRETMCCPMPMSQEEQDREAFIRNVECVLCQLDPTTPRDKFVLEFKLIKTNVQTHVDRWVTFCAASRAKHIVFDFKPGSWGKHDKLFSFPLHLFINGAPAVRSLCLMSAYLNPVPGFCGFTNLRKLKLDSVSGDIQCMLLPACSMLEWLSIVRCTLHSLTTSQPLRQLRYLCVHHCFDVHKLEVQAPNLITFMFGSLETHPAPFMLDGCLEIQEVTIKLPTWRSDLFDYAFADHGMANVPKLSVELAIDSKVPGCAKCPSKFVNLKHLILTLDVLARDEYTSGILRLACLLELSPVLKHLELHMACLTGTGEMLNPIEELPPAREPHYHLKTLQMTGVYGYNNLFILALHYARTAMALEHMVIDPEAKKRLVLARDAVEEDAVHWGRRMANEHLRGRGLDGILTIL